MWDDSPVIVGVGEASERIDSPDWRALSPADLAAQACRAALTDASPARDLAGHIDVIAAVRQFEISAPRAVAPFGRADNFPRAVARRLGAEPRRAILEPVGGQGPQHLVNEFAREISANRARMVLLCGAEAISTVRRLLAQNDSRDWSEAVGLDLEDRGFGDPLLNPDLPRHGARTPITVYALFENARRARLGLARSDYRLEMGRLFAPFTTAAATNPHAMSQETHQAEALAEVTGSNRLVADPYTRRLVARDQANQGAAALLTSVREARALGISEDRFIYLHGAADLRERLPLDRQDLSASPAAILAAEQSLQRAGITAEDIDLFDLYSCFPIAVFNLRDGLGLSAGDPRPLTLTGGLPYFGGAGNNYSMHALASMVRALRERPGARGLVSANGGFLSKTSVGVYSARPAAPLAFDDASLQAEIDAWPAPPSVPGQGSGRIETYAIDYAGPAPAGVVIARRPDGARFIAMTDPADPTIVQAMIDNDPSGGEVWAENSDEGRGVIRAFDPRSKAHDATMETPR